MRKKFAVGILAAVSASLLAIAPSASAYETVTNTRTQPFDTYPDPNAKTCITRYITLAQYWYDWQSVMFGRTVGTDRAIKLASDNYTWVDCMSYYETGVYQHWSTLTGDHHAAATLTDVHYTFTDDPRNLDQYSAQWGSQLVPTQAW